MIRVRTRRWPPTDFYFKQYIMLCILLCILNSHWIIQFELETNFCCGSPYSCKKQESILFLINTYKIWILITIRSLLDCWGLRFRRFWWKRCFFHEFLWFWQLFTNFFYSSSFAVILCELVGLLGTKISPILTKKGVFFTNFFDFDNFSRISPIFHHLP